MKFLLLINVALLGAIVTIDYLKIQDICSFSCSRSLDSVFLNLFITFGITLIILIVLSLFHKNLFLSWKRYVVVALPLLLVSVLIISSGIHHNKNGSWQNILDIPILIGLYSLFIVGSIMQIARAYYRK